MNIFGVLFMTVAAVFFLSGGTGLAGDLSQDSKTIEEQAMADSGVKEVQWLWGEVVSVDAPKKQISVKYLDYETDNEKEISLFVNEKTAYENIKDISELKTQDIVSVDYISDTGGKNSAVNISVEKLEDVQNAPAEDPQEPPSAGETQAETPAQSGD